MAAATRDYFVRLTELELIPHKHGPRKELLELTEEITLETFLDYLNQKDYLQKS